MDKKSKLVAPGQKIGTEEEYVAGAGTYTEGSSIYAAVFGELIEKERTLNVFGKASIATPAIGSRIIGRIQNIVDPIAIVNVYEIEDGEHQRYPVTGENFVLKTPNIKRGYVKQIKDEYRIGDIIRAKIIDIKNGECHLSTEEDDCGCIKAFASQGKGRYPLVKTATGLVCKENDEKENRKIASDYITLK
ncbi:MAG: exosome complex RNA-binding protein Csl4 [Candidatus Micrarchaeota archaeon]